MPCLESIAMQVGFPESPPEFSTLLQVRVRWLERVRHGWHLHLGLHPDNWPDMAGPTHHGGSSPVTFRRRGGRALPYLVFPTTS